MPVTWDPSIARYRDAATGQTVARSTVLDSVEDSIAASITAQPVTIDGVMTVGSDFLAQMVGNDLLDPGDWNNLMRGEIKREYIRQYTMGIGGVEQMTQADWGSIGGMLGEQYKWLDRFTEAIEAGELSEAQIRSRAEMYISSSRESYERANRKVQIGIGMTEMRWVLDPAAEHCVDCEEFANIGWVSIESNAFDGCLPGSGCTQCRTRCRCFFEYR